MWNPLRIRTALWSMLALFAIAGTAWAQAPTVTLSASRVAHGTAVMLRARGLAPSTPFELQLRRPDGTTRVEEIESDERGRLVATFTPEEEGMWIVRLRGDGVHSIFGLAVTDETGAVPDGQARNDRPATPPAGGAEEGALSPPDDVRIEDGDVVALRGDDEAWRLAFPEGSGPTGPILQGDTGLWVAHGLSLLAVDPATGAIVERFLLPAPVTSLAEDPDGLVATVAFEDGMTDEIRLSGGVLQETVRFGTHAEAFTWLRHEADVADPGARLAIDPTNPWLYLLAGQALARDSAGVEEGSGLRAEVGADRDDAAGEDAPVAAADLYGQAVARGQTFFDLAGIGAELYAAGEESLANQALDAAFRDFAERGYDPALLTREELRAAYGFPLVHLQTAVAAGDRDAAAFWAPWAFRMAGGSVEGSRQALRDHAALLRDAGDREGAALWSARAGEVTYRRTGSVVDRTFVGLAHMGWPAALALFAAALLLYATLTAKYWRPQTLHLRQRREAGRPPRRSARLVAIRYFSLTEKLVLVLLLAGTLAMAGLAAWNASATLPGVVGSGTLASAPAQAFVAELDGDPARAAFASGYASQVAGDESAARESYRAAGAFAPAVNNLGALEDDERLYQRALDLAPGLPAARYNLGRITSPSPFHEAYRPGEPLLVTPSTEDLKIAAAGSWRDAIARAYVAPWAELRTTPPAGIPVWAWTAIVALFFVLALAAVVALVIPRPYIARNAPRTPLYHALVLLVPGTGLADELWGVLLLAPWSILALDALLKWTDATAATLGIELATTLAALALIYGINLVALVVEFLSYRRRMHDLRKRDPELARRFGLRA